MVVPNWLCFTSVFPKFMENGLIGLNGARAARRVGLEHRQDNANARTPDQNMAEGSVKDLANRPERAIPGIAPVWLKILKFKS